MCNLAERKIRLLTPCTQPADTIRDENQREYSSHKGKAPQLLCMRTKKGASTDISENQDRGPVMRGSMNMQTIALCNPPVTLWTSTALRAFPLCKASRATIVSVWMTLSGRRYGTQKELTQVKSDRSGPRDERDTRCYIRPVDGGRWRPSSSWHKRRRNGRAGRVGMSDAWALS